MMRKLAVAAGVLIFATLGACGNDDNPAIETGDKQHNEADIEFAQGMIPHHEQAIEMSDMVIENGENPQVEALATRIKEAQAPEIETMRGWLEDWGEPESPSDDAHGGGHGGGETMMMTDAEMRDLKAASGADLDRMFLEMMIRHHEGAISMAEKEVEEGRFPAAKELAQQIITTQQAEIGEMKTLLTEL